VKDDHHRGAEDYCREIEAYLCRKNDGHLIRIVGPAFERVCAWAERGIPLAIAFRGIDRTFERYYRKGPRRRPVRIEFCEADVLDVFDQWRRAVGIPGEAGDRAVAEADGGQERLRRQGSLPAHLDRVVARLTALRAGETRQLDDTLEAIVRELDTWRASAKTLRGEARERLLDRLQELDGLLLDAARAACDPTTFQQLERDANAELAPFRTRLSADAYEQARRVCLERIIRERFGLPIVAYDRLED
jgi:hypothetical protein